MELFLKSGYKLMFKFDAYFRNIEVLNSFFIKKKSINSFGDMVSYTPKFKHKNNQKASLYVMKGAGCCIYPCDVISSVA